MVRDGKDESIILMGTVVLLTCDEIFYMLYSLLGYISDIFSIGEAIFGSENEKCSAAYISLPHYPEVHWTLLPTANDRIFHCYLLKPTSQV